MARTIFNVGVFIFATIIVVNAAPAPSSPAPEVRGKVMAEYDYYNGGWGGEDYGCCECCEPDHPCCRHKAPEVTVHVIQPPPTFIYDVTQTAHYTEHQDCCHCPYVCGPTCIPQGEVLAPGNVGRRVAISRNKSSAKAKREY
ncbi:hypothetical protein GGH94_003679 [Coemansia aciculifera]|uniref:Uncharacterized protein n=1 Tax=Coemansia aciculifera TaxID=417176 RepID=A0A9W8IJK5_9FUNG|nr:hypothetical protein GGH94_003679 [Coemansia aciculifera]KAJ2873348.1 hypothetical protein GGH93_003287 [Coemansia aciculifera]KAJ2880106.1 hypothetical protein H4R27_004927 [Coemansia aciculifera]